LSSSSTMSSESTASYKFTFSTVYAVLSNLRLKRSSKRKGNKCKLSAMNIYSRIASTSIAAQNPAVLIAVITKKKPNSRHD
jgi:hypothetical protein